MLRESILVGVFLGILSGNAALAAKPSYDPSTLESAIVEKFLGFVHEPMGYAYQMIEQFKKEHTNELNPEGGIRTPITREQLSVVSVFREEISRKYCDSNGLCTVRSVKEELLITIPTQIRTEGAVKNEKIVFTMKGGFKTLCKDQVCQDASVFYLPEDADIVARSH